jgi:hypothetical protein
MSARKALSAADGITLVFAKKSKKKVSFCKSKNNAHAP